MAVKFSSSSFSCAANSLFPPKPRIISKMTLLQRPYNKKQHEIMQLRNSKVKSCHFVYGLLKLQGRFQKRQKVQCAISEDQSQYIELKPDSAEQVNQHLDSEDISLAGSSSIYHEGANGRPGLISFYNRPYKIEDEINTSDLQRSPSSLLWLVGPAVLVASFIFPSLYLRRIISTVFEDSLLTDFLILFFTEALFYCGVAVFLLLIDRLRRPIGPDSTTNNNRTLSPQLGQRISSVAALVLSLIIPLVTMGLVWPWTGPAASATLAPYLVGIVVQFAFEQYARYRKSPSWPVIPIIFQVYRLHQLNRASQLVTALSFTVRGAEMTAQNLAINKSLGALLNVLQLLGVICIWSLSSFLMRFFPPTVTTTE
ncbi:uncharacterized protein LOC116146515 isoform X1 [Pistacia vera]|uniref:uncharacterized protein LOC116146515 isoform X1 n=1 Tax=Pistacia vera TaxID=55513 RepID=UPI00126339F9|nr:uncharacterized protein LOC116146515 isoform X1 [Pistacia vera]